MNAIAPTEFNPTLAVINGTVKTTSLKVAEHFGKRHDNVIRAIKSLECSNDFTALNFEECYRINELANGKPELYYEMTKDGFTFLAMGFTGKEVAKWKEAYINAFNKMAEQLSSNLLQLEPPTITKAQQGILFNVVAGKSDHSGKSRSYYWSRFASHFKLSSYKDLPLDKFDEAHEYLQGLEGEEMLYLTVKELSRIVGENVQRAIEGELLPKPNNALTIDLKFPDGVKGFTINFDTSNFHTGRWFMQLNDGELSIKALSEHELCMTPEQWIKHVTHEYDYVVGKKLG